jgi:hypothetical protein
MPVSILHGQFLVYLPLLFLNEKLFDALDAKKKVGNVPSLSRHGAPDSWVSASSLHDPEMPGRDFRGASSCLGDNEYAGISNSSLHSFGEAFSSSRAKYK